MSSAGFPHISATLMNPKKAIVYISANIMSSAEPEEYKCATISLNNHKWIGNLRFVLAGQSFLMDLKAELNRLLLKKFDVGAPFKASQDFNAALYCLQVEYESWRTTKRYVMKAKIIDSEGGGIELKPMYTEKASYALLPELYAAHDLGANEPLNRSDAATARSGLREKILSWARLR